MAQVNVTEVDYFEFRRHLQTATNSHKRIEPSQKQQWKSYVREHKIREVVMKQFGRRFEKSVSVILDLGDDDWAGYYTYSEHDELVYKWGTTDD